MQSRLNRDFLYMTIEQNLLNTLLSLDAKGESNETKQFLKQAVTESIKKNQPLRLVSFTCSTIQSEYLFSDTPWLYVSTDIQGNNLEADLPRLNECVEKLRAIYPVELDILIGNTDPYYIYLQQFKNIPMAQRTMVWKEFAERWLEYKKNLNTGVQSKFPNLKANIVSWYELEKERLSDSGRNFEKGYEEVYRNIKMWSSPSDRDWELRQLKTQFGSGKYFENINCPKDSLLQDWIERKFAEYAVQALWIYEYMSPCILIQNEKPSDLRSSMYQPIIKNTYNQLLPIVYFFGVDNGGYR